MRLQTFLLRIRDNYPRGCSWRHGWVTSSASVLLKVVSNHEKVTEKSIKNAFFLHGHHASPNAIIVFLVGFTSSLLFYLNATPVPIHFQKNLKDNLHPPQFDLSRKFKGLRTFNSWINSIVVKNGVLKLSFKPEWFVDLFKAGNPFFLDFD
jgi:hypothetical protein